MVLESCYHDIRYFCFLLLEMAFRILAIYINRRVIMMRDYIEVILLKVCIKLRWWYFHLMPRYIKFYADDARKECHFQNIKTGTIHSQIIIEFNEDSPFYVADKTMEPRLGSRIMKLSPEQIEEALTNYAADKFMIVGTPRIKLVATSRITSTPKQEVDISDLVCEIE